MAKMRMTVQSGQDLTSAKLEQKNGDNYLSLTDIGSRYGRPDAMKVAMWYACVTDKAETIGQLPIRLYRKTLKGREEIKDNRSWRLFTQKPCDYLTMQGFLEMMVASVENNGSFYAYKERNDKGAVSAIIPFANQRNVQPAMDINGNVYYTYVTNDGKVKDPYAIDDLVIINKFTFDGYRPVRPIIYMATLLGIATAQDESYKELQENGITSQMALKTEGTFNDENAIARLKQDWENFRGSRGVRRIPLLEQGLTPVNLKLTPQESELLQQKEFTAEQICHITGVPLYRVKPGTINKGTLPEMDESYMRNKLNPLLVKFEAAWNQILPPGMKVEVDRKAFYAGSPWRLVEHVVKEFSNAGCTLNEMRADLGREPLEGGDILALDTNNLTLGRLDDLQRIQAQLYNNNGSTSDEGTNK